MLILDWVSMGFLRIVSLITGMVLIFRDYYMEGEENERRFVYLVLLFVFSMWILIVSPNLLRVILG